MKELGMLQYGEFRSAKSTGIIFALGWIAYGSTYLLRKPIGVIKADLEKDLDLSKSALGWLDTALLLPYAVMQMVLGQLGDKFGARQTFGIGLLLSGLSMISFGWWNNFNLFWVLLFINGTAQAQCWPNCTKVLLSWFSDEVRNSIFGMFGTCAFAGGVIGTMLAVYLQAHSGWRAVFFLPSIIVLLVGVVVLLFYKMPEDVGITVSGRDSKLKMTMSEKPSGQGTKSMSFLQLWKLPMLMEVAVAVFCLKVVRYCMYMWLPMYLLQQLKYEQSTAGILSTIFEVGGVLGSALIGFILDRYFQGRGLFGTALSVTMSTVALVMFTFTGSWGTTFNVAFLLLAGAFNAGPDTMLGGSIPADLGEKYGQNAAAATVGLVNGFGSIGPCIEGPLIGLVATWYGWTSVFFVMTVLSAFGALAVFRASMIQTRINLERLQNINHI
ncbi:putative glycerol-3-phosphate transporter 5 isoform X1 [Pomacea canaliculata]|uniref:putative glycerol-3-phosphate transporter 5 isoform X1 n=2 Tax=Pomacea canaliculata TaxID=400727 RepID=UPI000D732047|nr:putative glycerol-3-phosphate transporter 5 isoform X1 [Pomacea canaliculata]